MAFSSEGMPLQLGEQAIGQAVVEDAVVRPDAVTPCAAELGLEEGGPGVEMVGPAERIVAVQVVFAAAAGAGRLSRGPVERVVGHHVAVERRGAAVEVGGPPAEEDDEDCGEGLSLPLREE